MRRRLFPFGPAASSAMDLVNMDFSYAALEFGGGYSCPGGMPRAHNGARVVSREEELVGWADA